MTFIKITHEPIDLNEARVAVQDPHCGAIVIFEGCIRNHNEGQVVHGLEYEVHAPLLRAELDLIVLEARSRWKIHAVSVIQRIGRLEVGETGIVIAVSSAHRHESLEACEYIIEEFKKRAPVWKRERYKNHSAWINCKHAASALRA